METIDFTPDTDPQKCIEIVKIAGAVLLRKYVSLELCQRILAESDLEGMREVRELDTRVRQEFDTLNPRFPAEATPAVVELGESLIETIQATVPAWQPNDVAIQRYWPSHIGIEPHRDYERDRLVVAVATLQGAADFHIELDTGHGTKRWSTRKVEAGDLVLMRAPGLTGAAEDRPCHSVDAPKDGPRVSIAYRHNVKLQGA